MEADGWRIRGRMKEEEWRLEDEDGRIDGAGWKIWNGVQRMEGRGLIWSMGDKGWRLKYRGWTTADEIWTMEWRIQNVGRWVGDGG